MALHEWELHGGAYLVVGEGVCLRHDGGGVRGLLSAAGVCEVCSRRWVHGW